MAEENAKPPYSPLEPMEKKKGGFTASSFIFVLLVLDHMGFMAIMVSMVLYFIYVMHLDLAHSANLLTNFMGSTYLLALALVMMTTQAYSKYLQPKETCTANCVDRIAAILFGSLCLMALGSGGVRGALPALGVDQFNRKEEAKSLATIFNWLMLSLQLEQLLV
ncbi:hypothetical protein C1H46_037456 [Malus baccata]|uniref:Uncharacterized protein n=1 Tax=Malus baccata TaxID=106549 RepID=A0A540KS19_MALBA|nr:hypothetical protein C1H46_037456 [Malus baccata]